MEENKEEVSKIEETYTKEEVMNLVNAKTKIIEENYQQLAAKYRQLMEQLTYRRLDYLFKVVDNNHGLFNSDFVMKCAKEIEDMITIPEPEAPDKADSIKD